VRRKVATLEILGATPRRALNQKQNSSMDSQFYKLEKAKRSAEQDLVDADAFAGKRIPGARQQAREMRRQAKRRRSKAQRRKDRYLCNLE